MSYFLRSSIFDIRPFFNSTFQGDDALCAEFSRGQGVSVSDQPSTVATSMYPRPQPFTDVRNLCADGWLVDSSELGYFANPSDSVEPTIEYFQYILQ